MEKAQEKNGVNIPKTVKALEFINYLISTIGIFIVISAFFAPYNRTLCAEKIQIVNGDSSEFQKKVSKICDSPKSKILKEMIENGELMSSDEFASRITSYYNILVAVLGVMFAISTVLSHFILKNSYKEEIRNTVLDKTQEMLRDSIELRTNIISSLKGELDAQYLPQEYLDSIIKISDEQKDIKSKLSEIEEEVAIYKNVVITSKTKTNRKGEKKGG